MKELFTFYLLVFFLLHARVHVVTTACSVFCNPSAAHSDLDRWHSFFTLTQYNVQSTMTHSYARQPQLDVVLHEVPFMINETPFEDLLFSESHGPLVGILNGGGHGRYRDADGAYWNPDSRIPTGFRGPLQVSAANFRGCFFPFADHGGNRGVVVEIRHLDTFPEVCNRIRDLLAPTALGPHVLGFRVNNSKTMLSETDSSIAIRDVLTGAVGQVQVVLDASVPVVHHDRGAYGCWKLDVKALDVWYTAGDTYLLGLPLPRSTEWSYRFTDGRGTDIRDDFILGTRPLHGPLHVQAFVSSSSATQVHSYTFIEMRDDEDSGLILVLPEYAKTLTYADLYNAVIDTLRGLGRQKLFSVATVSAEGFMATNTDPADLTNVRMVRKSDGVTADPTPISRVVAPFAWSGQEIKKWALQFYRDEALHTGGPHPVAGGGGEGGGGSASASEEGSGSVGAEAVAGAGGAGEGGRFAVLDLLGGHRRPHGYGGVSRVRLGFPFDGSR